MEHFRMNRGGHGGFYLGPLVVPPIHWGQWIRKGKGLKGGGVGDRDGEG